MTTTGASGTYHQFLSDENAPKWRGMFTDAIHRVAREVQPSLLVDQDAVRFVEELLYKILAILCAMKPRTVQDVEDYVTRTFDPQVGRWANKEAREGMDSYVASKQRGRGSHGHSKPLNMPVDRVHPPLCRDVLGYRTMEPTVTCYMLGIVEYMGADILKLAGNYVRNSRQAAVISSEAVRVAMNADKVLLDFFDQDPQPLRIEEKWTDRAHMSYDELVKDVLADEAQYTRDLALIIKVFQKFLEDCCDAVAKDEKQEIIDDIFENVQAVENMATQLLGSIEDMLEMFGESGDSEESSKVPLIGACFEEPALDWEFSVYESYAEGYRTAQDRLEEFLARPEVATYVKNSANTVCTNFKEAVYYVLPKLLLEPILHCFQYFDLTQYFFKTSPDVGDRTCFSEAHTALIALKSNMDKLCRDILPKPGHEQVIGYRRRGPRASIEQLNELQRSIEPWDDTDIAAMCSEILHEGDLNVHRGKGFGKTSTERHIFVLDSLLIFCKANAGRKIEFRLKEKFNVRRMELNDLEDCEEYRNAFEVVENQKRLILVAKTENDKREWMALLTGLTTKGTFDRLLDSAIRDEQRRIPLRLPDPVVYKFAEEDVEGVNIMFEEGATSSTGVPLVKGGTLHKLVERLTYHRFADPGFVRIFLTTYRSFCDPPKFLSLLVERFRIPDPPTTKEEEEVFMAGGKSRPWMKRFRTEYVQPVQLRIMNVLRHWVEHHLYDFDADMSATLREFLKELHGKQRMRKWSESVERLLERGGMSVQQPHVFDVDPAPLEYHIAREPGDLNIYTTHPIEIARQLTLIESEMYRAVRPSELVGSKWTSEDKETLSPNVLRFIRHSTNITSWVNCTIVESENLEERRVAAQRFIDIMATLMELNNFNGMIEILSALNSSAVHRLDHTFMELPRRLEQAKASANELAANHMKKYKEKLKAINPPCVPFMGDYLTQILFIEQGLKDMIPNSECINFSKRRKVAEVTGEIQQYQNQPYNLIIEPVIQAFLLSQDPLKCVDGDSHILATKLHKASLEIEPRQQPPAKFPRNPAIKDSWLRDKPRISSRGPSRPTPKPSISGSSSSDIRRLSTLTTASSSNDDRDQPPPVQRNERPPLTPTSLQQPAPVLPPKTSSGPTLPPRPGQSGGGVPPPASRPKDSSSPLPSGDAAGPPVLPSRDYCRKVPQLPPKTHR
ncbi:son of sevenless homolog 1-like [Sycon ciliatum]|uniref:son of sevenless homolog 1-like n=1 Tax=Sycon ciliatum TaxID=27933 RepID=UPI0020A9D9E2|eukprot:scpid17060/ scgid13952/ Son of sevenless homolog 1